ncbi:hypothetical protein L9F63_027888, partial [Diploptera punctata]
MAGEWFEVKMAALLFIRGVNQSQKFHLACNMKAGGSLDDIVFTNGKQAMFLQLKHRKDIEKTITERQLLQLTGKFSLFEYYKSYKTIKQQWTVHKDLKLCGKFEESAFIIYSNAGMNHEGGNICSKEWHHIASTGGINFQITEKSHPQVYETFDAVLRYKTLFPNQPTIQVATPMIIDIESVFKELNDIDDLSHYKEFFSKLWFYVGQLNENDLQHVIKEEITKAFSTSEEETQNIYSTFREEVLKWWKTSNRFLTESAELWEKICQSRIHSVSEQTLKSIQRCNVQFNSEIELTNNVRFLNIVTDGKEGSMVLCSLMVHQILSNQTHMILFRSVFERRRSEVLVLWEKWCDTLVIIEDQNTPIDVVSNHPNKHLIYISSFQTHVADLVIFSKITLNHLTLQSKSQILSTIVRFQGYSIPLEKITGNSDEMLDLIPADIIVRILLGERLVIGLDVPSTIDYFIPRTLEFQHSLSTNILCLQTSKLVQKSDSSDCTVFAISGLTLNEFELLMSNNSRNIILFQQWKRFYEDKSADKCLFVIINKKEDFYELAKYYENIHWIHSEKYTLKWKKSKGDISVIRNTLDTASSHINIQTILDLPQKVVLLSAEPGMGKTTLVDYLVCKTKEIHPQKIIFNINLNESIIELDALPQNMEFHDICKFLLDVSEFENDFRHLLQRKLENMSDVTIVLDGLDEISPVQSNKVIQMVKQLASKQVEKLWITTRCSSRNQLELSLSTLCYSLVPLSENEQKNLIMKFWKSSFPHTNTSLLTKPCNTLMQWLTSYLSDKSKQFKKCIEEDAIMTPKAFNILELFRNFIDNKFSIFCARHNMKVVDFGASLIISAFKKNCFEQHTCLALITLFSTNEIHELPNSERIFQTAKEFILSYEMGYDKLGIIKDIVHENPIFIHRTFAEFFAAQWFSKNYKNINESMREKLLDPLFQVTRHFFNRILAEQINLHTAILNNDKFEVERLLLKEGVDVNTRDKGGRTALHLAVMNFNYTDDDEDDGTNNNEIIKLLITHKADVHLEDDVLKWRPLKIAGTMRAWSAINHLLENGGETKDLIHIGKEISTIDYADLFRIISKYGFVKLLEFLMQHGISVKKYFNVTYPSGENSVTLLHEAVRYRQVKLVEFLLKNHVEIDVKDSLHGRTALTLAAVQGEQQISNIFKSHGASDDDLFLSSQHNKNMRHEISNNTLQWAAASGDIEKVKNLLENVFHVNCVNDKFQTALWCAAWSGKLPVVQLLLKRGADMGIHDSEWGWSPLHVAAKWGYLETVETLLQHGANVFVQDINHLSPLDLAVRNGHITVAEYIRKN